MLKLVQLGYFPMIIAFCPDAPCVITEAFELMPDGLLKALGYVLHVPDWGQFFYVQPLSTPLVLHDLHKLLQVISPSTVLEGNLGGVVTPHYVS